MKSFSCLLLLSVLFASCKKTVDRSVTVNINPVKDGYTEYIIAAAGHYAAGNVYKPISNQSEMRFMAWFDSSCIYTNADQGNLTDINKLYGFGDCNAGHQESSARFGWNWNGKAIAIYAYCYSNNKREWKLLGSVQPGQPSDMSIKVLPNQYIFRFNNKTETMERSCSTDLIEGYQLYPYFGGDETAPHEMKIYIKDL